ncbi:MarR family transcriptional regulator [Frondihabitans sp. 4ASC-45]|uniref:MarR family winged helix-turn-helix transcriptional regulator n=1 Tax=Frondihabitans sp. 4ASC-45 TaxID=3111636 RepID=UPI003C192246
MSLYDVFFALTRVEIHLWDRVDEALRAEVDVPLGRFEALLVVRRLGPCRILDISRELVVTVGGTSKLVDRLEETGLCVRAPNPNDRRSSLITLSESAAAVLERGEAVIEATLRSHLGAHLGGDELAALLGSLRVVRRGAESPPTAQ